MRVIKTMILLAVIAALMMIDCAGGPKSEAQASATSGYLTVKNEMKDDLILFAGRIIERNNIGGVRKFESQRINFFDKFTEPSGTFMLRAVKETTYRNKGSAITGNDEIFACLVSFDKNELNSILVVIPEFVGGDATVMFSNDSVMAAQIRVHQPDGPILTTLAPGQRLKQVYMDFFPNGYIFFPVYQYNDQETNGIKSIVPDFSEGIVMMPMISRPGMNIPIVNLNSYSVMSAMSKSNIVPVLQLLNE